jgi:IS30 family transposase
MKKTHKKLSLEERIIIETLLAENRKKSYIAIKLNRSRSTITREVNLWVSKPTDTYSATLSNWYSFELSRTKHSSDRIKDNSQLKIFIYRGLLKGDSPELISGRLKFLYENDPMMRISHESIYQHIYRNRQSKLGKKLISLLVYHHHKRRQNRKTGVKKSRIKDPVSIDDRPKDIETRQEAGHLEGDLMIGVGHKSAIGTIVDRKTRFLTIVPLESRKSKVVTAAFAKFLLKQPAYLRKTMTYDNGMEMAFHKWLTKKTGMAIYFAHPYSSWERGTNENTNGLIRRYLPKGTDFNEVSSARLKEIETILNNRPRKVLGFRTPSEARQEEIDAKYAHLA